MDERELTNLLQLKGEIVTEQLDRWASIAGERIFFYYGEDNIALSFAEFARRTDAIAGNLTQNGIGKGEHVSVFCTNSLTSALLMFGIWKAGAVYCPVNFTYTGPLLEYQLCDTRPRLIVTEPRHVHALNEIADRLEERPIVVVHEPEEAAHDFGIAGAPLDPRFPRLAWAALTRDAPAPRSTLSYSDAANLIYTSGTTGPAKGVLQPHRWMAQYTYSQRLLITQDDVIYNDLPLYHVGGAVANVCRAAWVGCEVAVWNRFSPDSFWSRIRARGATTAILLDVMIPWLAKAAPAADDRRNTLNKVHMQPLSPGHAQFAQRFGIDYVTAGFGQTETGASLSAVIEEVRQDEGTPPDLYAGLSHEEIADLARVHGINLLSPEQAERKGLMGKPTRFVEVSIRNQEDELCEEGEIGHLTLRPKLPSMFLSDYLGKEEIMAAAVRNLWFHTGDSAFLGEDGMYYYADRLGDRIRVRGENLSSFQVEDLLNRHPLIQMCAVVGISSAEGEEDDVIAFVVPSDENALTAEAIHSFAAATMPKFMRPRQVHIVAELPRTPTNKVEKYRLRQIADASRNI